MFRILVICTAVICVDGSVYQTITRLCAHVREYCRPTHTKRSRCDAWWRRPLIFCVGIFNWPPVTAIGGGGTGSVPVTHGSHAAFVFLIFEPQTGLRAWLIRHVLNLCGFIECIVTRRDTSGTCKQIIELHKWRGGKCSALRAIFWQNFTWKFVH